MWASWKAFTSLFPASCINNWIRSTYPSTHWTVRLLRLPAVANRLSPPAVRTLLGWSSSASLPADLKWPNDIWTSRQVSHGPTENNGGLRISSRKDLDLIKTAKSRLSLSASADYFHLRFQLWPTIAWQNGFYKLEDEAEFRQPPPDQYAIGQPRVLYLSNQYSHIKGTCHCTHLTSAKRPNVEGSTQ